MSDMITMEITRSGLDLSRLPTNIREGLQDIVERTADFAYKEMQRRVPIRTGRLRRSIVKQVNTSSLLAFVGPTEPYWIYVEFGTMPHLILPINAQALRFETPGRGIVFSKIVHHPGTRAQPFMQDTAEATRRKISELWKKVWDQSV